MDRFSSPVLGHSRSNCVASVAMMVRGVTRRLLRVGLFFFVIVALSPSARAANTYYWDTTTASSWSNGADWANAPTGGTTGTAPSSPTTDFTVFNEPAINGALTITLTAPAATAGITFNNTGTTTIQSSTTTTETLTIGTGGITVASTAATPTIGNASDQVTVDLAGSQSWTNNSTVNTLNIANTVTNSTTGNTATVTLAGAGNITISGPIQNNGTGLVALTDTDTGTLLLIGTSTYTGATSVTAGTLSLSGTSSKLNGGTNISISSTGNLTEASNAQINGAGTFSDSSSGTVSLAGTNTYTGATSVSAGTFNLTGVLGTNAGTGTNISTSSTGVFLEGSTGVINGTAVTFTQGSSGTSILSGPNTYGGGTTVNAGTLNVTNGSGLAGGAVTVASGAALDYDTSSNTALTLGSTLALTGLSGTTTTIGGSIGATPTGAEITVAGNATAVSGANVKVNVYGQPGASSATGTYTLLAANGTGSTLGNANYSLGLVYNNTNFTVGSLTAPTGTTGSPGASSLTIGITSATPLSTAYWVGGLSGAPQVWSASDGSSTSNWSATASGSAQALVPGNGTIVTFSDTSVNTEPTASTLGQNMIIDSLVIQDTHGLTLNNDGYTLSLNPASSANGITMSTGVAASTIAENVALGAAQTWTNNSANALTVSGVVNGSAALTTAGTGTIILSANNPGLASAVTISAGTLQIGNGGTTGTLGATTGITLDTGATLAFDFSSAVNLSTLINSKTITGGGSLTQMGSGTLNLNAMQSFTGGANILSGTLNISGTATGGDLDSGVGTINMGNGGSANATLALGGNGNVYANPLNLVANSTGALTITDGSNITYSGAITLGGGGTTLTIAPTSQLITFSNTVTGTGNIVVDVDTSTLAGNFTNTVNNAGTISVENGNATSGGATISGNIGSNVTGVIQNTTTGTTTLSGVNTYFGDTTVSAGTLKLGEASGATTLAVQDSVVNLAGGTVTFATGTTAATMGGLGSTGGTGTLNLIVSTAGVNLTIGNSNAANGSGTNPNTLNPIYSGIIENTAGTASVTKVGTNTQTFTGVNTYNGTTSVNAGSLLIGQGGNIADSTGVTVAAGATFGTVNTNTSATTLLTSIPTLALSMGTSTSTQSNLQLSLYSGGTADKITASTLTLGGSSGTVLVTLTDTTGDNLSGQYNLMTWTSGTWTTADFSLAGNAVGEGSLAVVGDDLVFNASAVPEPSTYALIVMGLGVLALCHRRRLWQQA
jgi:fibronectin-binding autotransporter adhesin